MKTLRSIFVTALLVAPVLSLNAGALPAGDAPLELRSTSANVCYYYWAGNWYMYPC